MSISQPKIVYTPAGGSATTLQFSASCPPVDFDCYWDARAHDNLSTSGAVRERVVENADLLMSFQVPHMIVDTTMPGWAAFLGFAVLGGTFQFYPNASGTDYYNCVLEDKGWHPKRNAPRKYGATVVMRILQDAQAPADPGVVLRRYYGVTT